MFKVNNRNTRTRCEICSKSCCSVSIVNFEQVNAGWDLAQLLFVLREKLVRI